MSRETYEMRSDNTIKIALMSCMHSGGQQHAIEMTKLLKEHFFLIFRAACRPEAVEESVI